MSQVIDRRLNGKNRSAVNRQRFTRRFRTQIRDAVAEATGQDRSRSVTDVESGEKVSIPARDISEPIFQHGSGGRRERVHPGNKEFVVGDRIRRPQGADGSHASDQGEGEDSFTFNLSRDEFLEFFFDGLELPRMVKAHLGDMHAWRARRAGYTIDGTPGNIHVVRTLENALMRRIALQGPYRREIREKEAQLLGLKNDDVPEGDNGGGMFLESLLQKEIQELRRKMESVPFVDTFDIRYKNFIKEPKPITQAVMFCLMDVSGSMGTERKSLAKRFFMLLHLFLVREYEHVRVVFIRHHIHAKEVSEEEFFYSRETGGTVVSSALELMDEIISERYPVEDWNIYAAQASDGDNFPSDTERCVNLIEASLLPRLQYFAYVEIQPDAGSDLWAAYEKAAGDNKNFAAQAIFDAGDIYPVFRELFKKEGADA